jgi:hypothetical protein
MSRTVATAFVENAGDAPKTMRIHSNLCIGMENLGTLPRANRTFEGMQIAFIIGPVLEPGCPGGDERSSASTSQETTVILSLILCCPSQNTVGKRNFEREQSSDGTGRRVRNCVVQGE